MLIFLRCRTLYDSVSDEESDERDDEIHSYNRRSFLDNLADILLDYTQEYVEHSILS